MLNLLHFLHDTNTFSLLLSALENEQDKYVNLFSVSVPGCSDGLNHSFSMRNNAFIAGEWEWVEQGSTSWKAYCQLLIRFLCMCLQGKFRRGAGHTIVFQIRPLSPSCFPPSGPCHLPNNHSFALEASPLGMPSLLFFFGLKTQFRHLVPKSLPCYPRGRLDAFHWTPKAPHTPLIRAFITLHCNCQVRCPHHHPLNWDLHKGRDHGFISDLK